MYLSQWNLRPHEWLPFGLSVLGSGWKLAVVADSENPKGSSRHEDFPGMKPNKNVPSKYPLIPFV